MHTIKYAYLTTLGSQEWLNKARVGKIAPAKKTDFPVCLRIFWPAFGFGHCSSNTSCALNCKICRFFKIRPPIRDTSSLYFWSTAIDVISDISTGLFLGIPLKYPLISKSFTKNTVISVLCKKSCFVLLSSWDTK